MKELSLHILDIAQNSIVAKATQIFISIVENTIDDSLVISIVDNGVGMERDFLEKVIDPYTTSRTTRKVGMGIPLLNDACRAAGGTFKIESEKGRGTSIIATLGLNHIDRQPLGDIAGVIVMLISSNPNIRFIYTHKKNRNEFKLDTNEVNEALDGVPVNTPEVGRMLREMICLNLDEL